MGNFQIVFSLSSEKGSTLKGRTLSERACVQKCKQEISQVVNMAETLPCVYNPLKQCFSTSIIGKHLLPREQRLFVQSKYLFRREENSFDRAAFHENVTIPLKCHSCKNVFLYPRIHVFVQ